MACRSTQLRHVPVLIVGGGPVGLSLASELGWHGVGCEVVDGTDGVVAAPRWVEVNIRTMELFRRWGVDRAVINCPFPLDYPLDVVFLTSMSGVELARIRRGTRSTQVAGPYSPECMQPCSQIWLTPILQIFSRSLDAVSLRYQCQLTEFRRTANGVEAGVLNLRTGEHETVCARYLVGCDGAGSFVRQRLGIDMKGPGVLGHSVHMHFRTPDLLPSFGRHPGSFFLLVDNAGLWATLRLVDPLDGLWRLNVMHVEASASADTVDKEGYLLRALGRHIDVEWIDISVWARRCLAAESYCRDGVFLAGDAAHQISPTGALGGNTGVGDAVDLGWKLAATINGWSGPSLLDSYDLERRSVGALNATMAAEIYFEYQKYGAMLGGMSGATLDDEDVRRRLSTKLVRDVGRNFETIGLQIGYCYDESPICIPDGSAKPGISPDAYRPTARPGARAPHIALGDGRSTLDLFGRGFTLLRCRGAPTVTSVEAAAKARHVPLRIVTLNEPEVARLFERKLVLVRPDGHVAWRGDEVPRDAEQVLRRVCGAT